MKTNFRSGQQAIKAAAGSTITLMVLLALIMLAVLAVSQRNEVVVTWLKQARLAGMAAVGKSRHCSLRQILSIPSETTETERLAGVLLGATVRIASDGKLTHWRTPLGSYWMPSGDRAESLAFSLALIQRGFYGQAWESVHRGDVVVDVGAHAGVFTRRALSQGASRVIAFEALPIACEALRRTFAGEISNGRVVVVNAALWDSRVKLHLLIDVQDSMRTSLVMRGPGAIETQWVLTDTLDSQLQALGQSKVDFIKVHVEGAENRVLRGARETIAGMHPRIVVPAFHTPDDVEDLSLTLKAAFAGYQFRHCKCAVEYSRIRPEMMFAGF